MKKIELVSAVPLFLEESPEEFVCFGKADYQERIQALQTRMARDGIDAVVIYGDREKFSNLEYLTGYDCRFEEALYVLRADGRCAILVGNEGASYAELIPYDIDIILYQNLSLQGQPREKLRPLRDILRDCGIASGTRLGIIGYKYMEDTQEGEPADTYDIPAYMLDAMRATGAICRNYTAAMTGLPDGVRMTLRSAKEIAWAEYGASVSANVVSRMLRALRVGISELELSACARPPLVPQSVHPMVNFGAHDVGHGLRSPGDKRLVYGEVCGLCYGVRGSLTSKIAVASYDESGYAPDLLEAGSLERFYKPFWSAIAAWYETVGVGVATGEVYEAVMRLIGDPCFGVALNPGHYIGTDEWPNSNFKKACADTLRSGAHLQCDIITSSARPVRTGICEDTVVIADAALRDELAREYPAVAARIAKRRNAMRETLGICLSESVLPLSNLNGVYHPFMLNTGIVLGMR